MLSSPNQERPFRIISLTSNIQKLLEKAIITYLEETLKIYSKLTRNQFGFRKKKYTKAAIHKLTGRVEDTVSNGNYALGSFLDIED